MNRALLSSTCVVGVLCVIAFASGQREQSGSDGDLAATVAALTKRVTVLEAKQVLLKDRVASLENPGANAPSGAAAPPGAPEQVIQLISFETVGPSNADQQQIVQLQQDAQQYDQQAEQNETQIGQLQIGSGQGDAGAQLEVLRRQIFDYRSKARKDRHEIQKLASSKQILHGWDGANQITMKTERDLSGMLVLIEPGAFISWQGRRIDADQGAQLIIVTSIRRTSRPNGFNDQSGGR